MLEDLKKISQICLYLEMIYAISDSSSFSLVHIVPKKSGVIVEKNGKCKELQTILVTKGGIALII